MSERVEPGMFRKFRKDYQPVNGVSVRSVVEFSVSNWPERGATKLTYWRGDKDFQIPLVEKTRLELVFGSLAHNLEDLSALDLRRLLVELPRGLSDVYLNPEQYYQGTVYSAPRLALNALKGRFYVPWYVEGQQGANLITYPQFQASYEVVRGQVLEDLPLTERFTATLLAEVNRGDQLPEENLKSLEAEHFLDSLKLKRLAEKYGESGW